MSNRIITIEREYASGGREVGELVAKQLGIPFYNREILEISGKCRRSCTKELFVYADAFLESNPFDSGKSAIVG